MIQFRTTPTTKFETGENWIPLFSSRYLVIWFVLVFGVYWLALLLCLFAVG